VAGHRREETLLTVEGPPLFDVDLGAFILNLGEAGKASSRPTRGVSTSSIALQCGPHGGFRTFQRISG